MIKSNPLLFYMQKYREAFLQGFFTVFGATAHPKELENSNESIVRTRKISFDHAFFVQIPFSGIISGEYFFTVDRRKWDLFISDLYGDSADELSASAAKEFLNTIVGEAIFHINEDFPGLTYSAPRIIEGKVDFPSIETLKSSFNHEKLGDIQILLTIDLMKQEISTKLEEEIKQKIWQTNRARKAETTIQSILQNINLGILQIDLDGIIAPGCSKVVGSLFFKDVEELFEKEFTEVCPIEVIQNKKQDFKIWLKKIKDSDGAIWSTFIATCPLKEVAFTKDGIDYIYGFSYHLNKLLDTRRILIVIEEITQRRILEKKLMNQTAARVTLEGQLRMAHAIQKSLLPSIKTIPGVDIMTSYQPAEEVGGDWYGYFYDHLSKALNFYMGDVTGHGVSAALLTAVSCGSIYSMELLIEKMGMSFTADKRLLNMAQILDQVISQIGSGQKVMSMVFMSLDLESGRLTYLNAGHLPGFIIRTENNEVTTILGPGSLLGTHVNSTFSRKLLQLKKGDMVFLYTDGLIENTGPEGHTVKLKKVQKFLAQCKTPKELIDIVQENARLIWKNKKQIDDVAMLAFRWNGPDSENL